MIKQIRNKFSYVLQSTLQRAICSIVRASFSEILNHQTTKMTKIVLLFLVLAVVSVTFANGKTCWKSCTGKIIARFLTLISSFFDEIIP